MLDFICFISYNIHTNIKIPNIKLHVQEIELPIENYDFKFMLKRCRTILLMLKKTILKNRILIIM